MCGIIGLHLRDPALYPQLGQLLTPMIEQLAERGPDSAGVAVYGDQRLSPAGQATISVLLEPEPPSDLSARLRAAIPHYDGPVDVTAAGPAVTISAALPVEELAAAVTRAVPEAVHVGGGTGFAVLKGVGSPMALAESFQLSTVSGWQAVAHTRMATESAVTAAHSHPFSVGPAQCLVHNGSFANHATIRRELMAQGVRFDSDNDSEVGARFVAQQLAQGADLEKALRLLCEQFDGFYTLLVTTDQSFAVVRDAIACKPAIIAEHPRWVAMASEYRALADLPGIEDANLFEPEPEQVYVWQR
ncbi:MAG: glutamine amidotransferase class-II [Pseudonocardiales bacterium]|nr:glutamine amidotransferase class-II [Pseudonocardiales bacterium]